MPVNTLSDNNIKNVLNYRSDKVSDKIDLKEDQSDSSLKLTQDFNTFLQLLTTQLKHQDPTDPMETKDFTNQVVMFSQVEQQININKKLEQLIGHYDDTVRSQALSYIDKEVVVAGNKFEFSGAPVQLDYALGKEARIAAITIKDSTGRKIHEGAVSVVKGDNSFTWDGTNSVGVAAANGRYTFTVSAIDSKQDGIKVDHFATRMVTGVRYDNGKALLETGSDTWDLESVLSIR